MTLKDRIIRVLDKKGLKYSDLCGELEVSEEELDDSIRLQDVKLFENISKLLKIPLYSFYHDPNKKYPPNGKRYYDEDIWED